MRLHGAVEVGSGGWLRDVPLAARTTLGVGGSARFLAEPRDESELGVTIAAARRRGLPILVLGCGSNLLVADAGFPGLVVRYRGDAVRWEPLGARPGTTRVAAQAGADWDSVVARAVARGLCGIECLSGIPGCIGAAPMQNIGAYGQEIAETLRSLRVVDVETGEASEIAGSDCGLGYRDSRFKHEWRDRYVVVRVDLELRTGSPSAPRYEELRRALDAGVAAPAGAATLSRIREAVIALRRGKSMLLDAADENHRSAGSFFTNPVVEAAFADEIETQARSLPKDAPAMPRWTQWDAAGVSRVKLSAAWLIERAGFARGHSFGRGRVGISTRHTLALVNRGGATAAEILAAAAELRRGVRERFGVTLSPEPVFVGFGSSVEDLLGA
jgi:UDP-N-acetylmuramate dehydrogenase